MKAALKYFQICLILGLTACGAGSKDREPQSAIVENTRKGVGSMTISGHFTSNERRLTLKDGSKDGEVYCQYSPSSDTAWIALGTFGVLNLESGTRINNSDPLTGLHVTFKGLKDQFNNSILASETFFRIDGRDLSRPMCEISSEGLVDGIYRGRVSCKDDIDRAGWGKASIVAEFTCNFKGIR